MSYRATMRNVVDMPACRAPSPTKCTFGADAERRSERLKVAASSQDAWLCAWLVIPLGPASTTAHIILFLKPHPPRRVGIC